MKYKLNGKIMEKLKPLDQRCITISHMMIMLTRNQRAQKSP